MSIGNFRVMRRIRAMNPGVWPQPVNGTETWFKTELRTLGAVDPLWMRRPEMWTWFTEEGWNRVGAEIVELALSRGFDMAVYEELEDAGPHLYEDDWQLLRYPSPATQWLAVPTGLGKRLLWSCSKKLEDMGHDGSPQICARVQEFTRKREAVAAGLPDTASWIDVYEARRLSEVRRFDMPEQSTWRAVLHRRRKAAAVDVGLPSWTQWDMIERVSYLRKRNAHLKSASRAEQTLIVVDVQTRYVEGTKSHNRFVRRCVQQIKLARRLGWPIVLTCMIDPPSPEKPPQVEVPPQAGEFGETHPEVIRALTQPTRYERFEVVFKIMPDGSDKVLPACRRLGADEKRFRFAGIFTHQCVWSTIRGVNSECPDAVVEVVKRACFPQMAEYWDVYLNNPRILLLPTVVKHTELWDPWMLMQKSIF